MTWQVPSYQIDDLRPKQARYAVVIPVINEGPRIRAQLARMRAVDHKMDVVIADGGSTDGSLDREFLREQGVRTLLTKTGRGKLSAQLRMGFAWALDQGYRGVVTIDGNGKDSVESLGLMRAALEGGYDFVQGSRFAHGGRAVNTPTSRYLAIRLVHAPVISLGSRRWWTDTTNGFRAHSAQLLTDPRVAPFRGVFDTYELLAYLPVAAGRIGCRTAELPVARVYPSGEIPTKISSPAEHLKLLRICCDAAIGRYGPLPRGS